MGLRPSSFSPCVCAEGEEERMTLEERARAGIAEHNDRVMREQAAQRWRELRQEQRAKRGRRLELLDFINQEFGRALKKALEECQSTGAVLDSFSVELAILDGTVEDLVYALHWCKYLNGFKVYTGLIAGTKIAESVTLVTEWVGGAQRACVSCLDAAGKQLLFS